MATAMEPEACKAGAGGEDGAEGHAGAAEEVRAYFVEVRGGAPFLSAADGRALVDWLEAGVSVSRLLIAIDRTAARRRARRVRTPFRLRDVAPELRRLVRGEPVRVPVAPSPPLSPGVDLEARRDAALAAIAALPAGDPEARARAACAIGRDFFHAAWEALAPEWPDRLAAAAEELADLRALLDDDAFAAACEELARDHVRRRFPELTASRLCEEMGLGLG